MSRLARHRRLVAGGPWHLTEHALLEAEQDQLDALDVEHALFTGQLGRDWPKRGTFEIIGRATVYEDRALH